MGKGKNIFIMTDLEGISGIDSVDMIQETYPDYEYCLKRLMADINAAVEGAFQGGAEKVYVCDGHKGGGNFINSLLDQRAVVSSGSLADQFSKPLDAVMLIGAHAMAGTLNGFLDHTQDSRKWYNYFVNGRKTGEIGQMGIIAGNYNIPIIMVSGDQAACTEAMQFFGYISCAVVKQGTGRNKAELVDEEEALVKIREAAKNSISLVGKVRAYKPLTPLEIRLELCRSDFCDELALRPGVERLDERTVRKIAFSNIDIFF